MHGRPLVPTVTLGGPLRYFFWKLIVMVVFDVYQKMSTNIRNLRFWVSCGIRTKDET